MLSAPHAALCATRASKLPRALRGCMVFNTTDGAVSAMQSLLMHCRVATEEDEVNIGSSTRLTFSRSVLGTTGI